MDTVSITLNHNITLLSNAPIINTKASEAYVSVKFDYGSSIWAGYVPIEYRRTGTFVDFNDKKSLYLYLNSVYVQMKPEHLLLWKQQQLDFWKTKPKATTTKEFFDTLSEGGWKCGSCEMPRNPNPQRRVQDLKDFGYTIATDLSRYCSHCRRNTSQRMLLPLPRISIDGNGYETWSPQLRSRIIQILHSIDVYENSFNRNCLPDHKFPEIRWDDSTKSENPDTMTDTEICAKFQLLTNQRNLQKREVCRHCYQTGERGVLFGISFFYAGGSLWDPSIPSTGKCAEKGCIGCGWYDISRWRDELNRLLLEQG